MTRSTTTSGGSWGSLACATFHRAHDRVLVGVLVVAAMAWIGCSESATPVDRPSIASEVPAIDELETSVLRPGDTLFEHLSHARLVEHPATLLPRAVAELAQQPLVDWFAPLSPDVWKSTPTYHLPEDVRPLIEADPGLALWYTVPPLSMPADSDGLDAFFYDGKPVPTWDGLTPSLLAAPVLWYPRRHGLVAFGHSPPEGVESRVRVPSDAEFGELERGRLLLGRDPRPVDLLDRFELGTVDRPALLLAADGVLEWTVDRWEAEGLEVAVGLMDSGWIEVNGAVQRTISRSDGVTLAIEVDGQRVWERRLGPGSGVAGWVVEVVDIPVPRGAGCTLRLLTEAGPDAGANADSTGDYAVWGSLRAVGPPTRTPDRPHVVVIDIDTLRADRLAAYRTSPPGAEPSARVTTPGIDAWAAEHGVVYTDSVSTAPWTLPATVSLLTGLAVHQHGVDAHEEGLAPSVATLASRLGDAGYETWGMVTGAFLGARYGCSLGFDRYESLGPRHMDWAGAVDRLTSNDSERPVFIFLQTYAVHQPYPHDELFTDPTYTGFLAGKEVNRRTVFMPVKQGTLELSPAELTHVEALYDALVVRMDQEVTRFIAHLQERVDAERLMIVFTSDHGEAFLEHGVMSHGQALYGEQLRVPLVVQYPNGATGRDHRPVSGLDLVPTVLDVVGLPSDPALPGRSLRGPPGKGFDKTAVRLAELDGKHHAVNSGGYKLMETDGPFSNAQLFVPAEDPGEQRNRAADLPDVVEDLRRRREWFLATFPPAEGDGARDISPGVEQLEQLRALGYLGDG